VSLPVVDAVIEVNEHQLGSPTRILAGRLDLRVSRVAVWGLTFKPDTDDLRDSPAVQTVTRLLDEGAEVVVHDPVAGRHLPPHLRHRVEVAATPLQAAEDADAVVHATEWAVYRSVPADVLARVMRGDLVVDGRNTLDRESLEAAGLTVACLGRPTDERPVDEASEVSPAVVMAPA
jgi:UDPglucose 6-dehydrogenase